jgi:tripeptide aminopeptidase
MTSTTRLFDALQEDMLQRFLRYVRIDTQSARVSQSYPSTEGQKRLAQLLVQELRDLGITNAAMDPAGYVYARLPARTLGATFAATKIPTICFCAHMDTSPDAPGQNVTPLVHRNYQGQDIALPQGGYFIRSADYPALLQQQGHDLVTSDGSTLLGADDKTGLAAIMTALQALQANPEIPHATLSILFTPDEEVGQGVAHIDLARVDADFGYTLDAEGVGTFQCENFSARELSLKIQGLGTHPGHAYGLMQNALKIAAEVVAALPPDSLSPETTREYQGYMHPHLLEAGVEHASLSFLMRAFDAAQLDTYEVQIVELAKKVLARYPRASFVTQRVEQYSNMAQILQQHPHVKALALDAIRAAGLEPLLVPMRGGTDGALLSQLGLPCPNIFSGQHGGHSHTEWASVYEMRKAAEVVLLISRIAVCGSSCA